MLAASLHTMGPVPSHTSPFAKYLGGFGGGPGEDKKKLSQTVSVPPRNAYSNLGYPPPSAPPPLPPPLACAPPPPTSVGLRGRDNAINCSNKGDQETDEEPLYMEATPLEKSFSYIQLDDIKYDNNPALSHHGRHHYSPFNKYLNAPLANSPKMRVCAYPNDFPNNLKINDSGSPNFPISPRNVSCSAQNMSSNTLNLWPSTSSLTPSNKTVPLTPAREKALNLNFALSPWNNLNGRGSISSCSESTSPYPGQTPKALRRPSNLSQCSRLFESCHNSSVTLNDICTTPCHPRCSSQDWSLPCITSKTRPFLSSPWHEKVQHLDNQSFSSCESVFTSGENLTQECNKSRNGLCKHSFSLNDRSELSSSTSHQAGHLSKSCGDVSPTTPLTEQDAIFDNMIQSAPTLPGAQNGLGFVKPVLRRVSQMFLASPSVYAPGAERKKCDDDIGVFFETSNTLSPDGMGGLEKKLEGKLTDGKGSTGIRKLGTRTISEASLKKDKMPMPTSPRRPPASSVSSTSFMHYKYSLLEKESNADRHALIPRSNSPEASDSSNSPNDRQAH
ncbi:hypothetical protein SK128_004704 [Halocaridina rubra]|uniref:Uncharacterized protein n=1 Tax=Halocaridina rubra TaxID=373956 RepID=A0AAN8WPE2_HALRR